MSWTHDLGEIYFKMNDVPRSTQPYIRRTLHVRRQNHTQPFSSVTRVTLLPGTYDWERAWNVIVIPQKQDFGYIVYRATLSAKETCPRKCLLKSMRHLDVSVHSSQKLLMQ